MSARRWRRRIGGAMAVLGTTLLVAACIALGPMDVVWRDRDANVILLAWDDASGRLVVNERIRAPLQLDGPYVRRLPDARFEVMRIAPRGGRFIGERTTLAATANASIDVTADNVQRTRFTVRLRAPADPPPATSEQPSRMLLLSDLEGDFDAFVSLLQSQQVIDDALRWTFGDGHLVLAGDFVDRGQNMLPLLWLIYRLEDEALESGGRVHYVLGNHELLVLGGRFGAAPQRIFASRDAFFDGDNRRVFAADTVLGQWLRAHNVVERIGDTLVVHGGISAEFLRTGLGIDEANAIARRELDVERRRLSDAAEPVIGKQGLPWFYGMAPEGHDSAAAAHLDAVLRRFGARRLAVGHTRAPRVMAQYGGRLLRLDVDHVRQGAEAALYAEGRWWRVTSGSGKRQPL